MVDVGVDVGDRTQSQMRLNHAVAEGDTGLPPRAGPPRRLRSGSTPSTRSVRVPASVLWLAPDFLPNVIWQGRHRFQFPALGVVFLVRACLTRSPRRHHPARLPFLHSAASIYSPSRTGTGSPRGQSPLSCTARLCSVSGGFRLCSPLAWFHLVAPVVARRTVRGVGGGVLLHLLLMMAAFYRSRDANSRRDQSGGTSRPPLPRPAPANNGGNVHQVPEWEKEFCRNAYDIPWETFCERKRFIGLHRNVMNWDDSGARKNFESVKKKFRAKYYGERWRRQQLEWWRWRWQQQLECWRPRQTEDAGREATPAKGRRQQSEELARGAAPPAEERRSAAAGPSGVKKMEWRPAAAGPSGVRKMEWRPVERNRAPKVDPAPAA